MKVGLILAGVLALFVLAAMGLWRTVGGLVEQAGAREERQVALDVRFVLTDRSGKPLPDAPVRLVFGREPQQQPPSAGQTFSTDINGAGAFSTRAIIDQTARARPTNFLDSLFAKAEPTDHIAIGAELGYMTYRWFYVANLYRFRDGDVLFDGVTLYARDEQGRFSRKAEQDGSGGWKIDDLGSMRMTTAGHDLTAYAFDPKDADHWALTLTVARDAEPIVR